MRAPVAKSRNSAVMGGIALLVLPRDPPAHLLGSWGHRAQRQRIKPPPEPQHLSSPAGCGPRTPCATTHLLLDPVPWTCGLSQQFKHLV